MPRYHPADSLASPRFTGVRTFARLPHVQTPEEVDVAVVPGFIEDSYAASPPGCARWPTPA